jgi:hypothetical protein
MRDMKAVWLIIQVDGKRGFVDATGEERLPPRYDFVGKLGDDRIFVRNGEKGSVLNGTGDYLFEVDAQAVMPFREGRAGFIRKGSWGFIDDSGTVVVEPTFRGIWNGHEDGVVRVMDGRGRQCLVDTNGQDAFPEAMEIRQSPRAGLVPFRAANKKWGLYSVRKREVVLEPSYADIFGDRGAHWILKKAAKKWGAADSEGSIVIEPKLPWLGPICEDRGATRNAAGAVGFVDAAGALVVEHQFESRRTQDDMSFFSDGRCAVQKDGKIGYIDRAGTLVVEPRWVNGFFFGEGRGVVVDEGGRTYVDEQGVPITEDRFRHAETFAGGIGVVTTAEGKGAVRRDGAMVVPPVYQFVTASDGVLEVQDPAGHNAYYRADGSTIWRHAKFEQDLSPALC